MLYRLKITKARVNSCKNIYACKHPETLYTFAHHTHYLVQDFLYLIPAQNNFHDLISICATNKLY
jgi:hypothetical protein